MERFGLGMLVVELEKMGKRMGKREDKPIKN